MTSFESFQDQSTSSKDDEFEVNQNPVFHVAEAALNEQPGCYWT